MKRLRRFISSLAFAYRWHRTTHGTWPLPTAGEPWANTDEKTLQGFLASETGRRLVHALHGAEHRCTTHAVMHTAAQARDYACGYAAGFRSAVAYTLTLSAPPAASAGPEPSIAEGADELLARLAP